MFVLPTHDSLIQCCHLNSFTRKIYFSWIQTVFVTVFPAVLQFIKDKGKLMIKQMKIYFSWTAEEMLKVSFDASCVRIMKCFTK